MFPLHALPLLFSGLAAMDPAGPGFPSEPSMPAMSQAEGRASKLAQLRVKGTATTVTILPVRLAGQPFDRATEVVGLLLERQGMAALELGRAPLDPGAPPDLARLEAAVATFIRNTPLATDCALYAEYNGSRQTGLTDLRAVLVDKTGEVLWSKRWVTGDPGLKAKGTQNPMGFSMVLAEQLGTLFGLDETTAKAAKPGPMARLMEARSGRPPETELTALPGRQALMKAAGPGRTLVVFPARVNGSLDPGGAESLTKRVLAAQLAKATSGAPDLLLKSTAQDPNEQKVLWDLACAFREHLRRNPPTADFALYVDCAFNPGNWEQGHVHVVVCDRAGDWVIVDFQNAHHPDYQALKPASVEACRTLAVRRLEERLR